jgi:hypothetical protein
VLIVRDGIVTVFAVRLGVAMSLGLVRGSLIMVFFGMLVVTFCLAFFLIVFGRGLGGCDRQFGLRFRGVRLADRGSVVVFVMGVAMIFVRLLVIMRLVVGGVGVKLAVMGVRLTGLRTFMVVRMILAFIRLGRLRGIDAGALDDLALDAVAMTAPARVAVARAAAVIGAVLALFLGLAMGALVGLDQRLTIGNRDLVIVGMDFAEGQEAVAVAAILDERRLQRRLHAGDLGEIDIAAQLLALGGLEIKFFDAIAADHDNPGLFRVGGIDQHLVGHFGTLDGGGRGAWHAQIARPGDATVHLIRG